MKELLHDNQNGVVVYNKTYIDLIQFDVLVSPFHFLCTDLHGLHLGTAKKIAQVEFSRWKQKDSIRSGKIICPVSSQDFLVKTHTDRD